MTEGFLCNAMADYGGAVYRLALCRTQSVPDAEDVYQDVFLRLLDQEAERWDGERLKAWLLRSAMNRCADLHRFRLRRPVLALEDIPEMAQSADERDAELWDAVARLPEKLRTVVHHGPELLRQTGHRVPQFRIPFIRALSHLRDVLQRQHRTPQAEAVKVSAAVHG